jgi:hypothetical protein
VKSDPDAAPALSVTLVPWPNRPVHVPPQVIAGGLLVIVPAPSPARRTVRRCSIRANFATTAVLALTARLQSPVVQLAPAQPVKTESAAGEAWSVIVAPSARGAEHVLPHLIPPVLLVTVPLPLPRFCTLTV